MDKWGSGERTARTVGLRLGGTSRGRGHAPRLPKHVVVSCPVPSPMSLTPIKYRPKGGGNLLFLLSHSLNIWLVILLDMTATGDLKVAQATVRAITVLIAMVMAVRIGSGGEGLNSAARFLSGCTVAESFDELQYRGYTAISKDIQQVVQIFPLTLEGWYCAVEILLSFPCVDLASSIGWFVECTFPVMCLAFRTSRSSALYSQYRGTSMHFEGEEGREGKCRKREPVEMRGRVNIRMSEQMK